MGVGEAGIDADEECVRGDDVGVLQVADDAVIDILEGWVAQEVAAEQAAGLDPVGFEKGGQIGRASCRERVCWIV